MRCWRWESTMIFHWDDICRLAKCLFDVFDTRPMFKYKYKINWVRFHIGDWTPPWHHGDNLLLSQRQLQHPLTLQRHPRLKMKHLQTEATSQKCQTWHTWAKACVGAAVSGQYWGNWPIWALGCLASLQVTPDQVVLQVVAVGDGGVAGEEVDGRAVEPGVDHQRLCQAAAQEGHQSYPHHPSFSSLYFLFSFLFDQSRSLSHIDTPPPSSCNWDSITLASCSSSLPGESWVHSDEGR